MTGLTNRLVSAVVAGSTAPVDPGLVPTVLTTACTEILPVDGAGLSLIGDLQVPLAASDADVRRAEQLQTTLGEGPCLSAVVTGQALAADPVQMLRGWPSFHHELTRQTRFRSVVSVPLSTRRRQPFGALDLYFTRDEPDRSLLGELVRQDLVHVVTASLGGASLPSLVAGADPTGDLLDPAVEMVGRRMEVWTAIGLVMGSSGMSQPEALALLRAEALTRATTLDDLAQLITTRRVDVRDLVPTRS